MNIEHPQLSGASFRFVQNGNTLGTTNDVEQLDVRLEFQLLGGEDDPPFMVLMTDGWSIDKPSEIVDILNACLAFNETTFLKQGD